MSDVMPPSVRADYLAFLSSDPQDGPWDLKPSTRDWFRSRKNLHSYRPMELYRGLFFTKETRDGPNPADAFLKGVEEGGFVSFPQPTCTSWTSVLGSARRVALNSRELVFPLMRKEFLSRKGDVPFDPTGIVITALMTPEDIVCNVEAVSKLYGIKGDYGNEREFIIRPRPSLHARVINIYTYQSLSQPVADARLWGHALYDFTDQAPEFQE